MGKFLFGIKYRKMKFKMRQVTFFFNFSHVTRKPVFGGLWPGTTQTTEGSFSWTDIASKDIILSKQRFSTTILPTTDLSRAVVSYWRKDVHLVLF